jgi:hypothetical protein
MRPYLIGRELIPEVWDQLEPMIKRSCDRSQGMASVDQILGMLLAGEAVCMGVSENGQPMLVIVATVVQYPVYCAARVIALAGKNLKEAAKHFSVLEDWALSQGAVEIEGWCGPAIARMHYRNGAKHKVSIVTWDLRSKLQ